MPGPNDRHALPQYEKLLDEYKQVMTDCRVIQLPSPTEILCQLPTVKAKGLDELSLGQITRFTALALVDEQGQVTADESSDVGRWVQGRIDSLVEQAFMGGLIQSPGETTLTANCTTPEASAQFDGLNKTLAVYADWLKQPRVVAIWFVDAGRQYWEFAALLRRTFARPDLMLTALHGELGALAGMKVVEWYSRHASEGDWKHVPEFCKTPGVWLEMSDGQHQRLEWNDQYPTQDERLVWKV